METMKNKKSKKFDSEYIAVRCSHGMSDDIFIIYEDTEYINIVNTHSLEDGYNNYLVVEILEDCTHCDDYDGECEICKNNGYFVSGRDEEDKDVLVFTYFDSEKLHTVEKILDTIKYPCKEFADLEEITGDEFIEISKKWDNDEYDYIKIGKGVFLIED